MKRLLALLMSLMLVLSGTALAEEIGSDDTLVVGSTAQMSGDFFAGLWSNNTADNDVRALLHDGSTVAWLENGNYAVNENVIMTSTATEEILSGDHTYTFTLRPGLQFSDGSAITAKDYVFSVLLLSAPQLKALGVANTTYALLRGWDAFSAGTGVFSGVRLLAEDSFSLTIAGDNLPYFYELSLVNVIPYPMAVLAPGCDVQDDGAGAYISGDFTAELLNRTILDAQTGYLTHPAVVSGAYQMTAYDAENSVAEFEMNPYYMGNAEGQKPSIQNITFRAVQNETLLDQLLSGEVDLVNKVSSGDVIARGMEQFANNQLGVGYYLRSGLSFLAFACEGDLGSSVELRKAVAYAIDSQELNDTFLQGYGQVAYAYYGYGQWMAAQQADALLELDLYELDLNAAQAQLTQGGFIYNAQGGAFENGEGLVRYRRVGAGYQPLTLKMAISENNTAAQTLVAQMRENFAQLGIGLEVTELPADELLRHYYRQTERTYDLFFMATNFNYIFDPYQTFNTADEYQGVLNTSGLRDEKLMELAKELRQVAPGDTDGYMAKWLEFQTYWVEVLPMVPLYSNVYFDFYRPDLQDYLISAYSTWPSALLYAYIGEPTAEGELPEGGEILEEETILVDAGK